MIKAVEKTMLEHDMLPVKSVLVGLSGGADSAALTHILCALSPKYGFKVYAAHVNHGLRGETADRDEKFSKALAHRLGIEFFCLHAKVREEAEKRGISEELAGREARYGFFDELMEEHGIECTATAHHKNDNAETILMNFMRGSGIKGLCGIPYKRDRIIRPLLDVSRQMIENYCRENDIDYVTDETNLETVYTRNKIRHIILPEIETNINQSFVDTVTKNAAVLSIDEDFLKCEADKAFGELVRDNSVETKALSQLHPAVSTRVIRRMLDDMCGREDVSSSVVSAALRLAQKDRTGSRADIARGVYAAVEYGRLYLRRATAETGSFEYELNIGESRYIPEMECWVHIEKAAERQKDGWEYFGLPRENCRICVRSRIAGDKFIPFGMKGMKKVKDFMINEKIPKDKRGSVGIVTFDEDIAWIAGYRRDNRFKFHKNGIKIRLEY
ncbi:MAG: tRNA lysidine(34) synthetase TilS [Candidatus Ornithomonoglobus sp.]